MTAQRCRVCGCTDMRACDGGCEWVELDLCSACQPRLEQAIFAISKWEVAKAMLAGAETIESQAREHLVGLLRALPGGIVLEGQRYTADPVWGDVRVRRIHKRRKK